MRPCHNYFLSFHIQNKVFHFTPLTQYIIVSDIVHGLLVSRPAPMCGETASVVCSSRSISVEVTEVRPNCFVVSQTSNGNVRAAVYRESGGIIPRTRPPVGEKD